MEEKSTLTSRSVAVVIIVVTLVALSVLMPSSWLGGSSPKKSKKVTIDVSGIKSKKAAAEDLNNDGQITWKEVVEETLPMSEQTKENLKDEKVDSKLIDELNDPNNLTASFSRNLYLSASYLEKNGMTDESSQKAVAEKLMLEESSKIRPTIYTYSDIKVAKNESKESIQAYGNTMATILDSIITKKIITDEISSLEKFAETKDTSLITPFKTNKKRLDGIVNRLITMEVPPSSVIYHTLALNRIAAHRDLIANISLLESDPLRSSLAVTNYIETSRGVIALFEKFSTYFNVQNITFSQKNPGYVFVIGYTLH